MTLASVLSALAKVLGQIQSSSGLPCPPLLPTTKVGVELPEFTSELWPVATTLLAGELGVDIDDGINIFTEDGTDRPLTLAQIAKKVVDVAKPAKIDGEPKHG